MSRLWSVEDNAVVIAADNAQVAALQLGRSVGAVQQRGYRLGRGWAPVLERDGNLLCVYCREWKSPDLFSRKRKSSSTGRQSYCKACANAHNQRYYEVNRDAQLVKSVEWYSKHRTIRRTWKLMYFFQMTDDEYERRAALQEYACALCFTKQVTARLVVDHDHRCCSVIPTCGKCVRGLLCAGCNRHFGYLETKVSEEKWPLVLSAQVIAYMNSLR